jgi:DNA (cytosine-5)-methyltransferase 1
MKELKVISLFSGYGTQELALNYCGINYRNIANCDILKTANEAYDSLHITELGNLGDVMKVDETTFPDCDLLTYSFPCQDISLAGNQRGIKKGTRSGLLYEVERIVEHNKPKYLLMENVKNLVSKNHMSNFQDFIDTLTSIGYGSSWIVLNGADFGCPQNRERVFMMSVLDETHDVVREKLYSLVKIKRSAITTVPMRPFLESNVDSGLYVSDTYQLTNTKTKTSTCQLVAKRDNIKFDQRRRIYSIDAASPTLDIVGAGSLPQIMMDDKRFRSITPREGYRFMGVRDNDIDKLLTTNLSNRHHLALAGNSICVPVMEAIFNQFLQEYKKSPEFSTSELEIKN